MNKGNTKRGFIPPQPAAEIAALDFAHASEALRRAHEAASVVQGEAATHTVAEVIAECADRLIAIPTDNPAHIAEKVAAYAWLHNVSPNLSDQATQWRIAEGDDDAAKGLLAIYLDLARRADAVSTQPAFDPAVFVADLLAADMTVGATPGGGLTELLYNGDKPHHANADAMRDRFHALTYSERTAVSAYISGVGR